MGKSKIFKSCKRVMTTLLAATTAFSAFGCAQSSESSASNKKTPLVGVSQPLGTTNKANAIGSDQADVWFAPGTQKIRPDVEKAYYDDIAMEKLSVKSGRSEYESAQIIISAKQNISAYDLTLSDLTLKTDASVKFSKDNITVYNQHYVPVDTNYESSPGSTPGYYPDALIPFEAAKAYKENACEKGNNQGIWITFYTGSDVQAGEYEGNFLLTIDGRKHTIPVTLKVWDYDFASNYTAKSAFLINWTSMSYNELDSSMDMYDAYTETLLNYRLNPDLLLTDIKISNAEDIEWYAQKAFDYAQDERVTNVALPFDLEFSHGTSLYLETTRKYLQRFIELSYDSFGTERQLNIVSKLMSYFTFCDEPTLNTVVLERVDRSVVAFRNLLASVKSEYMNQLKNDKKNLSDEEYAFRHEVISDLDTVYAIITSPHDSRISEVDCYCPYIHQYDSEKSRQEYANDKERWWYTAVGPHYPYPNYHIDDLNFLAPRLASWMQAEYDVVGNLYWSTNAYDYYPTKDFLEDPFNTTALRFPNANGDGYLFYPGKKYGVNGPIATIRLEAIRDGMEEYETLVAVENIYEEIDKKLGSGNNLEGVRVNFDDIYSRIKENLYDGVAVYTTQEIFDSARDLMATIAELANLGGAISSIDITETAIKIQAVLPKALSVNYDGRVKKTSLDNEYNLFTFNQPLDGTYNEFNCTIVAEDKECNITIPFGGEIRSFSAQSLMEGIKVGVRTWSPVSSDALIDASTVNSSIAAGTKWLRLDLPAADAQIKHGILIENSELLASIGANTNKLVFKIYSDRDPLAAWSGAYPYAISFKFENDAFYQEVRSEDLRVGQNEIIVGNIFSYDWETTGKLISIRIYFGWTNDAAENDLYLNGVDVYMQ